MKGLDEPKDTRFTVCANRTEHPFTGQSSDPFRMTNSNFRYASRETEPSD